MPVKRLHISKMMLLIFAIICYQPAFSAHFESAEKLNNAAKTFLLQNIQTDPDESVEILVNQSHTPLRVSSCSKEIEAAFPENSNKEQISAVELSCNDSRPWHVLVPVDVQIFSKVIVAKRTLAAKESISEEDVDLAVYNKNRLYNGYFIKKEEVVGSETVHLITAGTVLTKKNLHLPLLVHRNQIVSLISQSHSISVTMQGIARSDGSLNSIIKVFNPSSKKTLDAIVTGPNKAQISA